MIATSQFCHPPGTEFIIYRSRGTGYYPTPKGPRSLFVSKEDDEPVPLIEIQKALRHLNIPGEKFWEIVSHTPAASSAETKNHVDPPKPEDKK